MGKEKPMNTLIKDKSYVLHVLTCIVIFIPSVAYSQYDSKTSHNSSAKITLSHGKAQIYKANAPDERNITQNEPLRSGDKIKTGNDGLVEVLLNPMVYFRFADSTKAEVINLEAGQVKLHEGSMIIEIRKSSKLRTSVEVDSAQGKLTLNREGMYRINLRRDNSMDLLVYQGKANLGTIKIKKDTKAVIQKDKVEVSKLYITDEFDWWNNYRARLTGNRTMQKSQTLTVREDDKDDWWKRNDCQNGMWIYDANVSSRRIIYYLSNQDRFNNH
jgi:hypothetical protein